MIIRFSHTYQKFFDSSDDTQQIFSGDVVELLHVGVLDVTHLDDEFRRKDTEIRGGGYYELPTRGKVMALNFAKGRFIFTTIRRWTPRKMEYYRRNIGGKFEVRIRPSGGDSI